MSYLDTIKELIEPIVKEYNLVLISVKKKTENGFNVVEVIIDDPVSFTIDIDIVSEISEKAIDLVNDYIPDGYYLEISSLGIERELITIDDYNRALNEEKYIYVKTYQKIKYNKNKNNDGEKEFYGYLESFNDEEVNIRTMIKAREYKITIPKSLIALIRLAVKF